MTISLCYYPPWFSTFQCPLLSASVRARDHQHIAKGSRHSCGPLLTGSTPHVLHIFRSFDDSARRTRAKVFTSENPDARFRWRNREEKVAGSAPVLRLSASLRTRHSSSISRDFTSPERQRGGVRAGADKFYNEKEGAGLQLTKLKTVLKKGGF